MKLRFAFLPLALAALLQATPVCSPDGTTLCDPYGGSEPGTAKDNGDVIGLLSHFDVASLSFTHVTPAEVDIEILVNYNDGDTALSSIDLGSSFPLLNIGDILLTGASGGYGIPLAGHDGLLAGRLYSITDTLTAYDVLQVSGGYRPGEEVWISPTAAAMIGTGTVVTSAVTNALSQPTSAVLIQVSFSPTSQFLLDLGMGLEVQFAAATCGNDVLTGTVTGQVVPEPATMLMLGGGLVAIGLIGRRKSRRK